MTKPSESTVEPPPIAVCDEAALRRWYAAPLEDLRRAADGVTRAVFGDVVFLRGLIEFSNYCTEDCWYCGIRASNGEVARYRLSEQQVIDLAKDSIDRGLRTIVLQSGEDPGLSTDALCRIVEAIRSYRGVDCAVTLSCGMLPRAQLQRLRSAGADRYLLRFETADPDLHRRLRDGVSLEARLETLAQLRDLGYQVGSGFMVGLPGETDETRIRNVLLCQELDLDMVGIGPFIPHPQTPLGDARQEPLETTLRMTSLVRLALPYAHLPATTAAGSVDPTGREQMLAHGANVLMPNFTPVSVKAAYLLYPGKICLDESGVQCVGCMGLRVRTIDKRISMERGDAPSWQRRAVAGPA